MRIAAAETGIAGTVLFVVLGLLFLAYPTAHFIVGKPTWPVTLLLALFACVGTLFIGRAFYVHVGRSRHGTYTLQLHAPAILGGALAAKVVGPYRGIKLASIIANLSCWESSGHTDGGGPICVWDTEQAFPLRHADGCVEADVVLQIPADRPASRVASWKDQRIGNVNWYLTVRGHDEGTGIGLQRTFLLPVAATERSSPLPSGI